MRALLTLGLAAASALAISTAASAAPSIVVPIDQSTRLNIAGAAYSVLVGSPAVADVTVVDSRTLYISGRGYGSTDVVVLDREGGLLYRGEIVVTGAEVGRVSVYRGAARTDMACAPGCQVTARSGGATGAGGAAAGGGAPTGVTAAAQGGATP